MEKAPETGIEESSSPNTSQDDHKQWIEAQDDLKRRLVTEDDFSWKLSKEKEEEEEVLLRYVGGVDISFSKEDTSVACGTLVVLDIQSQDLQTVYHDHYLVTLTVPYVPGFLAFREVLMVDGNGILHPRGFGLACHLGVLADLPTIGIGKNLHHVDGLTYSGVRQLLENKENCTENFITLSGCSGKIWGVAMRSTKGSLKPIFISVGHCVSLDTAITIVKMTCKYRVPEPTRQADIRSREYLRKHQTGMSE
ncbi:endonuclease V-like isoform X2 [Quercus lobata]|uniref:endonuclease V-like isoform X2 n=1 Tax=Quercus lobata TaxID=97700 RepID=UPI0012470CB3|nr:endonuclease V-like isoform X2 [Quercus lobata]